MRRSVMVMVGVLALGVAACSPKPAATPAEPKALPVETVAPPAPVPAPQTGDAAPAAAVAPVASPAAPSAPAAEPPYRFSPGDFPRQERRIAALIANAETRDTLGETPEVAAQSRHARERCASRSCVVAAYAAEEARLRKWEGSSDIR